jgi:hypothetical protein
MLQLSAVSALNFQKLVHKTHMKICLLFLPLKSFFNNTLFLPCSNHTSELYIELHCHATSFKLSLTSWFYIINDLWIVLNSTLGFEISIWCHPLGLIILYVRIWFKYGRGARTVSWLTHKLDDQYYTITCDNAFILLKLFKDLLNPK